jgi:tetratricopeptide (TPR) repeat protein
MKPPGLISSSVFCRSFAAIIRKPAVVVVVVVFAGIVRGQGTDPVPQPSPEPYLAQSEEHDPGRRPGFLRPPQPVTTPRVPEPTPVPTRTIVTQIELPVSEPVAEEPSNVAPDGSPTSEGTATPEAGGPKIIFGGPNQPSQPANVQPSPTPVQDPMALLKAGQYDEVEAIATSKQDANLARAIGWALYNGHRYTEAEKWFEQAIQWNEADYEAAYGLTLTFIRLGDYDKAEETARWRMDEYPAMRKAIGDILVARAVAAYQAKEYRRSHELFAEAKTYRNLSHNEQIVDAWNAFQIGDYALAAGEFERLYSEHPDKTTASGLYAAYARQKNWKKLQELADQYGGPIAQLYRDYVVEHYYGEHLYANVYALAPDKYPELENYTSPSATVSGYARYKSGDDFSKLWEIRADVGLTLYEYDVNRIWVDAGWSRLENGGVPAGAFVGQVPLVGPRNFVTTSPGTYGALFDGRIGYQWLGEYTIAADIGISPAGGAVSPTVVGDLSLKNTQDWGNWAINFYRKSIKESILSYTGMKDPYTGQSWGRVTETGFSPTIFLLLQQGWSLSGSAFFGIRDGENVETNDHFSINLALGYKIDNPNFSYISIGPSMDYEQFSKNLSFFTFGQGGYFSPEYLLQGALGLQFMTKEGENYLLRGSATVGMQTYRQDASPVFPLENSSTVYGPSNRNTYIGSIQLDGLLQLTSQLAAGINVRADKTANYEEYSVGLLLKYFFEPRAGLFSTDF